MIGNYLLANTLLLFLFFPWLSFGLISTDTQPYFIILSILLVLCCKSVNRKISTLAIIPIGALIVALYYETFDFLTVRALLSYSTIFFTSAAYFTIRKYYVHDIKKWIYFANIIWLFVGCLQFLFGKNIFDFLVVVRSTTERGVTGLSPEPAFYGLFLIFISWIILIVNDYRFGNAVIVGLLLFNVLAIVFFAKSAMVFLILFYLFCFYFACSLFKSYVHFILLFVVGLIFFSIFTNSDLIFSGNRMGMVVAQIRESPLEILYHDESINQRARDLVYPILGALENFFIPNGFHQYAHYSLRLDAELDHFFWWGGGQNIIMSASGSIIYELGFISIPYFVFTFFCFRRDKTVSSFFECIAFSGILFFSAIPISFPLIYILLTEKLLFGSFPK